ASGPYPLWVENPGGYRVPVVHAGAYSNFLGDLTVTFDKNGVVTAATGDPILLDATIPAAEAVAVRIAELSGPILELNARRIAETTAAIHGSRESCRFRERTMGNLVADAMLDRARSQGIHVAIINGGGLRASIEAGPISMGDLLSV